MGWLKNRFTFNPGTLLYLQNNSEWYGTQISSSVISCDIGSDEMMSRMKKMSRFLSKKKDKPISWSDVMTRKSLFDESYRDEQAGDLIRDNCEEVVNMELSGGFLFGGVDGMKYVHEPKIDRKEVENKTPNWVKNVVILNCTVKDGYKCDLSTGRDSVEKLKEVQDNVKKLTFLYELKKWKDHPSKKAKGLASKIEELLLE